MKELVTADGMRQIEKHAMEKLQLSDAILMERAALFSAAVLEKELKKRGRKKHARILVLCDERSIAINALAGSAGVSPSTVYSILNTKSQNPGVVSLQKLCDGLGIALQEFINNDLFDNIEQEIK